MVVDPSEVAWRLCWLEVYGKRKVCACKVGLRVGVIAVSAPSQFMRKVGGEHCNSWMLYVTMAGETVKLIIGKIILDACRKFINYTPFK